MICMSDKQSWTLDQLVCGLKKESDRFVELKDSESEARRNLNGSQNTINDFQRMIDDRFKKMKKDVPCESKWGRERKV